MIDSSKVKINGKTRNLGPVAAMVVSSTAPTNLRVLWYDTNVTSGCPIKYYNLTSLTWKVLGT